jgi:hypothetical protein
MRWPQGAIMNEIASERAEKLAARKPDSTSFIRVNLTTLLLLILALGVLFGIVAQYRREAEIKRKLASYRNPITEGIIDALESPLAVDWPNGTPLDTVLKMLRTKTTGLPKLKTGMPIYIDPNGLQEAAQTPTSPVKGQPPDGSMSLGVKLRRALDSLDLAFDVKDGFLMITSKQSLDEPIGASRDPYVIYHDVLK